MPPGCRLFASRQDFVLSIRCLLVLRSQGVVDFSGSLLRCRQLPCCRPTRPFATLASTFTTASPTGPVCTFQSPGASPGFRSADDPQRVTYAVQPVSTNRRAFPLDRSCSSRLHPQGTLLDAYAPADPSSFPARPGSDESAPQRPGNFACRRDADVTISECGLRLWHASRGCPHAAGWALTTFTLGRREYLTTGVSDMLAFLLPVSPCPCRPSSISLRNDGIEVQVCSLRKTERFYPVQPPSHPASGY